MIYFFPGNGQDAACRILRIHALWLAAKAETIKLSQ